MAGLERSRRRDPTRPSASGVVFSDRALEFLQADDPTKG
jgi:hypothetical protein